MIPPDQTSYSDRPLTIVHTYSTFWPMAISLVALLIWFGDQDYLSYSQASEIRTALVKAQPNLSNADMAHTRYESLVREIEITADRDQYAAQIAKEAGVSAASSSQPSADH